MIINCLLLYNLCIDIDECLSGPCPSDLICNNTDGRYSCDCPDGTIDNGTDCICKYLKLRCMIVLLWYGYLKCLHLHAML